MAYPDSDVLQPTATILSSACRHSVFIFAFFCLNYFSEHSNIGNSDHIGSQVLLLLQNSMGTVGLNY